MYGVRADRTAAFAVPHSLSPLAPLLSQMVAEHFTFYSKKLYYTYALCYPTGLPFYVGVGNGRRCFAHVNESLEQKETKRWSEKNAVINELLHTNESVWYHFLALVSDRQQAAQIEAYWIKKWGTRSKGGVLTNSAKPESMLPDCPVLPPHIPGCNEQKIVKSFFHPIYVVPPPVQPAPRKGKIMKCPACNNEGQLTSKMIGEKLICGHCGHFVVSNSFYLEDAEEDNRIQFGTDVLENQEANS